MIPPAVAYVWRTRGRREALLCLGAAAAVVAVVVVPFLALAPHGVWDSIVRQTTRPLQIESLGAALLLAAHHVGRARADARLEPRLAEPRRLAARRRRRRLERAARARARRDLGRRARGPATPERLVRYSAASVAAFVALGKVLSPQFLIWLLPLVPLVRGRRGLAASALLGLALLLTQVWFPIRYFDLVAFDELPSWVLLARDLVLVALVVVLTAPARESPRS